MNNRMRELAKEVTRRINGEVKGANNWAKTSSLYGKEICGFVYNPYTVRRWISRQYMEMISGSMDNINEGIRKYFTYMDGIKFMIEEAGKMTMLEERDPIAFEERKHFWSVEDMKKIFVDYIDNCFAYIQKEKERCNIFTKDINIRGYGYIPVTVKETIYGWACDRRVKNEITLTNGLETRLMTLRYDINHSTSYKELHKLMKAFRLVKIIDNYSNSANYHYSATHCKIFIEGFKKSGAYYTIKNYIMFEDFSFKRRRGQKAVQELYRYLLNGKEGWEFHGMLKEMLADNN